jgi:hypothetical protein
LCDEASNVAAPLWDFRTQQYKDFSSGNHLRLHDNSLIFQALKNRSVYAINTSGTVIGLVKQKVLIAPRQKFLLLLDRGCNMGVGPDQGNESKLFDIAAIQFDYDILKRCFDINKEPYLVVGRFAVHTIPQIRDAFVSD